MPKTTTRRQEALRKRVPAKAVQRRTAVKKASRTRPRRRRAPAPPRALPFNAAAKAAGVTFVILLLASLARTRNPTRVIEFVHGLAAYGTLALLLFSSAIEAEQVRASEGRRAPSAARLALIVFAGCIMVFEAASWGLASSSGLPRHERSPSLSLYHGATGHSYYGGHRSGAIAAEYR